MRVDEKMLDKGWYFAMSASVFGNAINSSTFKIVIRFKKQPNKNKLLARNFPLLLYAGQVHKREEALGKRYTNHVKYIKTSSPCITFAESIQSSFWWIEKEISPHFIVKTKNGNLNI